MFSRGHLIKNVFQRFLVNSIKRCRTHPSRRRPLGNLERLYYEDRKIIPSMVLLSCQKKVTQSQVNSALEILVNCHPMLSTDIKNVGNNVEFVEKPKVSIPFQLVEADDWFPLSRDLYSKFANDKSLWKFIMIQNAHNQKHNLFQFIFSIHHSLADFPYAHRIIMDFLDILKDLQNGWTNKKYTQYSIPPPIENIQNFDNPRIETPLKEDVNGITTLEAYEHYYKDEIHSLAESPRIYCGFQYTVLESQMADRYFSKCKTEMVSKNAAIIATLVMSFGKLLEQKGCKDFVKFDFSFMTNLRRYMGENSSFYPGMAAVGCPLSLTLNLANIGSPQTVFWDLARYIKHLTSNALDSRQPLRVIHEDVARWVSEGRIIGKTKSVFVSSNVDKMDGLRPETEKYFRLEDFQVISDIQLNHYPIFMVLTHIMNGKLQFGIGYTASYTSHHTAKSFCENIRTIVHSVSS